MKAEQEHYFIKWGRAERRLPKILLPGPSAAASLIRGLEDMETKARLTDLDLRAMARGAPRASTK